MSDHSLPARRDGLPSNEDGAHLTLPPNAPLRPETGSALDLLLRRQVLTARGALLGFVPAQVR